MKHELEEGEIVLCTVDKIVGTTVFVKLENDGEQFHIDKGNSDNRLEGTITMSEISPGRIRNLREFVSPGKKIACKILKIQGDRIYLSLRRVKQNEKKELLDKISKEKSFQAILKTVLRENFEDTIEKIQKNYSLTNFFSEIKENSKILEKYVNKEYADKIKKIIESKKEKPKEIKQFFKFSNKSNNGMILIKRILLDSIKNSKCKISYIAAGRYRISIQGENLKELGSHMNSALTFIEKEAKKNKCFYEVEK